MHIFDFIRNNNEKLGQYFIYPRRIGIRFELYEAVPKVLAWIYEWGEDTAMWIKAGITGGGALLWLAGNFLENLQRQKQNRKRKKNKYHKRPSEKFQTAFFISSQNSTYFNVRKYAF